MRSSKHAVPGRKNTAAPGRKNTAAPDSKNTAAPGRKNTAIPGRRHAAALLSLLLSAAFVWQGCTVTPADPPDTPDPGSAKKYDGFIELSASAAPYRESFEALDIPLAAEGEGSAKAEVEIDPSMPEEAFRLDIEGDNMKITASGETGVFRALSRASRVIEGETLPSVHLDEEPDVPYRGVIEGFYGAAWTHGFRLDLMEFMGHVNLNTYIYAPKDDAKHRAQWRAMYTDEELEKLRELVSAARRYKVKFVYAISPGLDIDLDSGYKKDLETLFAKCESMYGIGVRNFAILLDDITTLNAAGHAKLLNDFQTRFIEKHSGTEDLIAITPEYCTAFLTDYTDAIAPLLNEKIMMMWTGNIVVPQSIRTNQLMNITRKLNRKVFIWWNYPVNDVMTDNLFLGPCENLSSDLYKSVCGLVSNPMNQGYASMAPLYTTADFLWDMEGYDPEASLAAAAKYLFPDCASEFLVFADLMRASTINGSKSAFAIKDDVEAYLEGTADTAKIEKLLSEMEGILSALETLKEKADKNFIADTIRWIEKARCRVETAADLFRLELLSRDPDKAGEAGKAEALRLADDINSIRTRLRGNTAIVSPDVLTPLAKQAQIRIDEIMTGYDRDFTFVHIPISNMPAYQDHTLEKIADKDDDTYFWTAGALSSASDGRGYIGLDLGKETEIKKIYITTGLNGRDALITSVVEYSHDGVSWIEIASGKLGARILLEPEGISGRYVRIRGGNSSETNWVIVRSFEVNPE